jgi:haloalkane dehalogenase
MSSRFEYPFTSRFATVDGVRLHYLDEGEGPIVWMMHGMPTWSYLYRKLIPPLVRAGYRCFVPDLMGFGLSDKPDDEQVHSVQRHVAMMTGLIEQLGLCDMVVMGQDWGGPISLRYAIEHKDNVRGLVILNTFVQRFPANRRERCQRDIITSPLPKVYNFLFKSGAFSSFVVKRLDVFRKFVWLGWRSGNPSKALGAGFRRPVDPRAMANYLEPHNTPGKRAAMAAFAKQIPDRADHPNTDYIDAIRTALECWDVPALVVWPDGDMAWKPDEGERIARLLPCAEYHLVRNAGHYLQEDAGDELALRVLQFLRRTDMPQALSADQLAGALGDVTGQFFGR